MAENIVIPPQIEADKRLLKYQSYEDYLDHLLTSRDECYLQSVDVCRQLAELGYRCSGETLTREQFNKRISAVINYHFPIVSIQTLASKGFLKGTNIQQELALREWPNKLGILSTIIFVRENKPSGGMASGYIDYADRLYSDTIWKEFFHGNKILRPKKSDLGYYNWKTGEVRSNFSMNYTVVHSVKGLRFRNRFDRQIINPTPYENPGPNSYTKRIYSKDYGMIVIIDHVVRQRI